MNPTEPRPSSSPQNAPTRNEQWLNLCAAIVFGGLFLWHWSLILTWALDLPFGDDWDNFPQQPLLPWLFSLHNEHRILTTRLLTLGLLRLNHWDLGFHQCLNFAIYGLVLAVLYLFRTRKAIHIPAWLSFLFLLPLLSALPYENHIWATQTQWHFVLLFLFMGVFLLFNESQQTSNVALGVLCLVLSIYSLSGGLVASAVAWVCFSFYKSQRLRSSQQRTLEIRQWVLGSLTLAIAVALYLKGYHRPEQIPPFSFPWGIAFWRYFFTLFASGFGLISSSGNEFKGLFYFILCAAPLILECQHNRQRNQSAPPAMLAIYCAMICIIGMLAVISGGRGGLGVAQAQAPRYTEFVLVLCPLAAYAWWWALRERPQTRVRVLVALAVFFSVPLLRPTNMKLFQTYQDTYQNRRATIPYLHDCYVRGRDCKFVAPWLGVPVTMQRMREAKELNLSFMKQIESGNGEAQTR